MLLNLSNHPSTNWPSEQSAAAVEQYHEIIDLAFPQISPAAAIGDVIKLAENYADQCVELLKGYDKEKSAVHLMGEMTFTYSLLRLLQLRGITCVASTTQRIAVQDEAGVKTSSFRFVQFRSYWNAPI